MRIGLASSVCLLSVGLFTATDLTNAKGWEQCWNGRPALTFDDGPTQYTRDVIDQLIAAGQKATFFINVNNFDCAYKQKYVDLWRYALDNKFVIGNHGAAHANLTTLSDDEIRFEINEVDRYTNETLGIVSKYFRIPYDSYDDRVIRIIEDEFHKKIIHWDVDGGDAIGETHEQQIQHFKDMPSEYSGIILLHATRDWFVYQVLPVILSVMGQKHLKSQGMNWCRKHWDRSDAYIYYNPRVTQRTDDWNCDHITPGGPRGPAQK